MQRTLAIATVLLASLFLVGCGGESHESLTAESVSTMKEMVTVLDGVKDGPTAKSAKPTLKSLMDKLNSISERQSKLPMPTEAEFKAIDAKYSKEMEETQRKFVAHMLRVRFDPKISAELDDIDMKAGK